MSEPARHLIEKVIAWDVNEGEAIVQLSCPARDVNIEPLEKEFNDRSDELFPGRGFIFDGWKLISGPSNAMKVFYATREEIDRVAEQRRGKTWADDDGT